MDHAATIILALMSPGLLAIFTKFLLHWRELGNVRKEEMWELRRQIAQMRDEMKELKGDHSRVLLDLEATTRRLETRVDRLSGIDAPPPEAQFRPPVERQL